jgi:transmembrane 9 superfamily protein 2/4
VPCAVPCAVPCVVPCCAVLLVAVVLRGRVAATCTANLAAHTHCCCVRSQVAVASVPRQIPQQSLMFKTPVLMAAGGVLPFGAVFVELFFILSSLWLDQYYYVFGFLLVVFALLTITCAEIAVVMVYFQLCAEDYRWWWRSVIVPGASGVYLFLYSIYYFATKLNMRDSTSVLLYFGYMSLISLLFFILTGAMGYFATFRFVHKIYSSIKVD